MSTPNTLGEHHVGDKNTRYKCTMWDDQNGTLVVVNAANYDIYEIDFMKPDRSIVTKKSTDSNPVDLFTDGTDGIIKWDDDENGVDSLLDVPGTWHRRGRLESSANGAKFTGSWIEFEVEK